MSKREPEWRGEMACAVVHPNGTISMHGNHCPDPKDSAGADIDPPRREVIELVSEDAQRLIALAQRWEDRAELPATRIRDALLYRELAFELRRELRLR